MSPEISPLCYDHGRAIERVEGKVDLVIALLQAPQEPRPDNFKKFLYAIVTVALLAGVVEGGPTLLTLLKVW